MLIKRNEERVAWTFLAPTLLMMSAFAIYPLLLTLNNSFTDEVFASAKESSFIGLKNYQRILSLTIKEIPPLLDENGVPQRDEDGKIVYERVFKVLPSKPIRYRQLYQFPFFGKRYVLGASDSQFYEALIDTIIFAFWAVLLETVLGVMIALLLNCQFKGRALVRAALLIPWAVPTAVSSRLWEWMFSPSMVGFFNSMLFRTGFIEQPISFLSTPSLQLPIMIFIDVWKTVPFMGLMLLAGLQVIPKGLYEAARIDGANSWVQFRRITLPLLMPILSVSLIFRSLDSLRVFDLFQIIYGQSRYSLSSYVYYNLLYDKQSGYSSAIGLLIFLLLFFLARFYVKKIEGDI